MTLKHRMIVSAVALCLASPTVAQTAEETTAKLNLEQVAFAKQQMAENAASQQAHDSGVTMQSEYEAEKARLATQHEQAVAKWQADVDACKAGERNRCAPPPAE